MLKKFSCIIMSITFVVLIASCNNKNNNYSIELKDFVDESITVEYGDFCSIKEFLSAEDINGNRYDVSAVLKDTQGTEIQLIGSSFKVSDINGYKLYLTVKNNSRKITIDVVDTISPIIRISDFSSSFGYKDVEYEIPNVDFYDLSGVKSESKKVSVYYIDNAQQIDVNIIDNKFTPREVTTYYIEASCEDNYGNSNIATKEFVVRAYAEPNEVEYFDDKYSVNSFIIDYSGVGIDGDVISWQENYNDESGVIKVQYKSNKDSWDYTYNCHWPDMGFFYTFKTRRDIDEYIGDYLVIRAYIPEDSKISYLQLGTGEKISQVIVTKGSWQDYYFSFNLFRELWKEAENSDEIIRNYFAVFLSEESDGAFYIDKIYISNNNENMEEYDNGNDDINFY